MRPQWESFASLVSDSTARVLLSLVRVSLTLGCIILAPAASSRETPENGPHWDNQPPRAEEAPFDLPVRGPARGAPPDTFQFGYYDGTTGLAVLGETWTFDHGAPDPLEGWTSVDLTVGEGSVWQRIDAASWAVHGNGVNAPIIAGSASAWLGFFEDQADDLCWESGLGYGNGWSQRLTSPELHYAGTGSVQLSFQYFNDLETDYDHVRVFLWFDDLHFVTLNGEGFTGKVGDPATSSYATFAREITQADFAGFDQFRILFEMTSDGGWSDQDGEYATAYGPFGLDDVALSGSVVEGDQLYDFEDGLDGFTPEGPEVVGSFLGTQNVSLYDLPTCPCPLRGNVLEFHDGTLGHTDGQHEKGYSPPVDRGSLGPAFNKVFAEYSFFGSLPALDAVFTRPGWRYYPWTCPVTGQTGWSPDLMSNIWYYSEDPECLTPRQFASSVGAPGDAELYQFILEVHASCDYFIVPPKGCSGESNFSPLFDDLSVRVTQDAVGLEISFDVGKRFQDGFGQTEFMFTPSDRGNADVAYDLHGDAPLPDRLGDSLVVVGPTPTASTRWESRLWWRIRREGPLASAIASYVSWKTAVADGLSIVGPNGQFTFGRMDSVQTGSQVSRNRFISEFREDDDDFQGENADNNEMIRDGILVGGTKIEYFLTANYTCSPTQLFYLPDTTGRSYLEFEILPSYRQDAGIPRFPCLLYLDLDTGSQFTIEHALHAVLNGAGPGIPIPEPTRWDRYDYQDASSSWNAPLARSVGGNNGLTLIQLLGYRGVLVNTGDLGPGAMESADFLLFSEWLSTVMCNGNVSRQGFVGNGDSFARVVEDRYPAFLANSLGTTLVCDDYSEAGCGPIPADQSACVRVEDASGRLYPSDNTGNGGTDYQYDVYGNDCFFDFDLDVLGTTAGGVGNRVYFDYDQTPPATTEYAQVVKSVTSGHNYRSVVDGASWHHLSERDLAIECADDSAHVVAAASQELRAALKWIYQGNIPGLCTGFCEVGGAEGEASSPEESGVTRLHQNLPNPFNPRTVIRFSLGHATKARLSIYDVTGREVRTLVNGFLSAGPHQAIWDGTDQQGHRLARGIYWSQLETDDYRSSRKMIAFK